MIRAEWVLVASATLVVLGWLGIMVLWFLSAAGVLGAGG